MEPFVSRLNGITAEVPLTVIVPVDDSPTGLLNPGR